MRDEARAMRTTGLSTHFGLSTEEFSPEFVQLPSQRDIRTLTEEQPDIMAVLDGCLYPSNNVPETIQQRQIEEQSTMLGAACMLNYFSLAFANRQSMSRVESRTPVKVGASAMVATLYDGLFRLPIGWPSTIESIRDTATKLVAQEHVYSIAGHASVAFADQVQPTASMLGDRFSLGAFAHAALFTGIGITEQVGANERLARMPRRAYKA